jgi:hypothetical protein
VYYSRDDTHQHREGFEPEEERASALASAKRQEAKALQESQEILLKVRMYDEISDASGVCKEDLVQDVERMNTLAEKEIRICKAYLALKKKAKEKDNGQYQSTRAELKDDHAKTLVDLE